MNYQNSLNHIKEYFKDNADEEDKKAIDNLQELIDKVETLAGDKTEYYDEDSIYFTEYAKGNNEAQDK